MDDRKVQKGMGLVESFWQDLRFARRVFTKNPTFTLSAMFVLAFGIGVNTATFTIFNAIALRPLPVDRPRELVRVERHEVGQAPDECCISDPDFTFYRQNNTVFSSLIAFWGPGPFTLYNNDGGQRPDTRTELVYAALVSGDYFSALGGQAVVGRTLSPEDERAGAPAVAVLSYAFWQRRFGLSRAIVDKTIFVQDQQLMIVGVAVRDFVGVTPQTPDIWVPTSVQQRIMPLIDLQDRTSSWLRLMGRLKPDVNISQAQSEMSTLAANLSSEFPATNARIGLALSPASSFGELGGSLRTISLLVLAAVIMVLLITCANVAALQLAGGSSRHAEVAIRLAVGAGPRRLIRQLLTENLVLGVAGGLVGLLFAFWAVHFLVAIGLSSLSKDMGVVNISVNLNPDLRVLSYTLALSLATGLLFGLAPALHASGTDLTHALKKEDAFFGGPSGGRRLSIREYLVVAQLAGSLVLLIGDGLLIRGLRHAQGIDPGYEYKHMLVAEPNFLMLGYDSAKTQGAHDMLRDRLAALAGVRSVAFSTRTSGGRRTTVTAIDPLRDTAQFRLNYTMVSSNCFETLGIPILRGRPFTEGEIRANAPVAVISEATASKLWPGEEAVGKKIRFGTPPLAGKHFEPEPYSAESQVIGVAKDLRSVQLSETDRGLLYLPLPPTNETQVWLMVRTAGDPTPLLPSALAEIEKVDRGAFPRVYTLESQIKAQMLPTRAMSMVGAVLGVMGVILASVGLYGVVAYSVNSRTREIGIRMALGATAGDVTGLVLNRVTILIVAGLLCGVFGAGILSKFMTSLLYGVNPLDPVAFSAASALLTAVGLMAAYFPARRVTRINPMTALRHD